MILPLAKDDLMQLKEEEIDNMEESIEHFQHEVGKWSVRTFPESTPTTVVAHLRKEVDELAEAIAKPDGNAPEEAADCFLLLLGLAHRMGFDLLEEARTKHRNINIWRDWGKPNAEGFQEHIRDRQ